MFKKLFKIFLYTIGLIIFIVVVVAGITQSKFFKDRLRVIIASAASDNLGGTLVLGTIRGNFISGFSIDSVKIYYDNEIFLSTGKISLHHDPFSILKKTITLRSLKIEQPIVHILKSRRNEWNIDKIFRPDTSKPGAFNWTIKVEDLKIERGNVVIYDSTRASYVNDNDSISKYIDYSHLEVKDLNINLAATVKDKSIKLNIKNIKGFIPATLMSLMNFSGEFEVNKNNAEVKNLLVTTTNSQFKIDLSLKDVDIFSPLVLADFKNKPLSLKFLANHIDFNELKSFIPEIYFLNGNTYVDLEAKGEFGNLFIKKLNVNTYNSSVKLSGYLSNLHRPNDLYLDVKIDDSKIIPKGISELLRPFNIPKFPNVNQVAVFASYRGNPLDFQSKVFIQSNAGTIEADGHLNLKNHPMKYETTFRLEDVNLEKIFDAEILKGSVYASGTLNGEGTNTETLNSKLNISIDSTRLFNLDFSKSNLDIQAQKSRFDVSSNLQTATMKVVGSGFLDIPPNSIPKYGVTASCNSIDLSKVLYDENYTSNLTFNIDANGHGKNINTSNAEVNISIFPSTFLEHKIPNEEIKASLALGDPTNKILNIKSTIADAELNGNFTLTEISKIVPNIIMYLKSIIHSHLYQTQSANDINKLAPFDFEYNIKAKDVSFLTNIIDISPSNFHGEVRGNISNSGDSSSLSGEILIHDFFYGRSGQGVLVNKGLINYNIGMTGVNYQLDGVVGKIDLKADQFVWNKTDFKNVSLNIDYDKMGGDYKFQSEFDKSNQIRLEGEINTLPAAFNFTFSTVDVSLDKYRWNNVKNPTITFDSSGFLVKEFVLSHGKNENISLSGLVSLDDKLDISANLNNFQLNGLKYFLKNAELNSRYGEIFGLMNSKIILKGEFDNPVINLVLSADHVNYRNTHFDNIKAEIDYSNRNSIIDLELKSDTSLNTPPDFKIEGNIPIDLSFKNVEDRFPEEQTNINILSDGFKLNLLEPLMPFLDNLSGEMVCHISIKGTPKKPKYSGFIEVKDTRFLLKTNNIYYNISGKLGADVDRIVLQNFEIKNDNSDYSRGKMSVNGFLSLKDFNIDSFDFTALGKLLFLKETSGKNLQSIFGRLVATTGIDGLHYLGTPSHSNITGTVSVEEANLVFPPTRSIAYSESDNIIKYIAINDTTHFDSTESLQHQFYFNENSADTLSSKDAAQSKWWLGLNYDITVESKGTTNIRMVFNPTTNEELYAELLGTMNMRREAGKNSVIGEISVSERSYYNFFKRFDATGKLIFLGAAENPELDILATYTGTRRPPTINVDSVAAEQKVVINLNIKGTRTEPNLKIGITIDDKDYNQVISGGDLQSDAISFLFTGKFRDDLTAREKSDIVTSVGSTAGKSILAGATSTMLSGILTDFLRNEFNFIRSAEISYQGGSIQQSADLRLSGQMFNAYWRFGGKIFNDINNANVSFLLNFGDIFETIRLKSLFLELERKVDGGDYMIDKKLTNSARVYYKWTF